ncbi:MAG TPA: tRNA adenosine(34) deaminase TadA [Acidobacteriota bacterium]|nr:tRNA adenosine(34) deaminase TadA [Acidobacteriota bacterium]
MRVSEQPSDSGPDKWMEVALQEARQAASEGEVPVGAVVIQGDEMISRDHNRCIQLNDPTAHAEILALKAAGRALENYRLNETSVFITLEPCAMCAGALVWARVSKVIFGAWDEKSGAAGSKVNLFSPGLFNHTVEVIGGVLDEPCREILRSFFSERR